MTGPLLAPENDYSALSAGEVERPGLRVAVVIPVYNRVGLLARTLAGISAQTYPHELLSVVIADDGSDEDVSAAVEAWDTTEIPLNLVRREHEGYGAGQARNLGALHAEEADVLVFFDADCIPDAGAVSRHAVWHHLASNLVVIGSRHHVDTSKLDPAEIAAEPSRLRTLAFGSTTPSLDQWISEDYRRILHRRTASLRHGDEAFRSLVSSNFSVRRSEFLDAGGFSEDFTRWGGEDTELGWRLWNTGMFIVDEARAAIYHQLQEDAGEQGWRQASREANDGLIQSKIPHRHYRKPARVINETPKVSVVLHSPNPARLDELTDQILDQRLRDLEVVLADDSPETAAFVERRHADPRFQSARDVGEALQRARGEFVALVHGWSGLDHRLLSRSVAALERRPRAGWVRSAYGVRTTGGLDVYRRREDTENLDASWSEGLPVFGMTRRRDLAKCLRSGLSPVESWGWVTVNLEEVSHGTPLVILPAPAPNGPLPESVAPPTSLRSLVRADIEAGGRRALTSPLRLVKSVIARSPYKPTSVAPERPVRTGSDRRPSVRYVGWTGHRNLGDEAMLAAVRNLFAWADVETEGPAGDLLMLGGGTLINRGYLKHLRPHDSPRVERVVFGTGVANPEYWGDPKEDPAEWVAFAESCAYVGVRGPRSADLLTSWGTRTDIEVVGDPALSLPPAAGVGRVEGRVVICPAWSRGLLWGGSDNDVFDAFAGLISVLRERGHDVHVLSAFPGDDAPIIGMMRQAGFPDLPYLAAHDDPRAAMELLTSAELVVSERLHGAVLSAAAGTVPVMVEYRPKLRDFAESIDLADLVIRTDAVGGGALGEMVDQAWGRRLELGTTMWRAVEDLRLRQRRAADLVEKVLRG